MNYSNSQRAGVILYLAASLFGGYITLAISAKYNTSFTAVIVSAVCWGMPVILRMLLMGMSAIFIYATPLFLVMHGCLDDVYGAEEIVLLISLVIGIICTITGFLKYKVKEAV